MRILLPVIALGIALAAGPARAADHFEFDKAHTRILFYINHMGFSEMVGEFTDYNGGFTFDVSKPEDSTIDMALSPKGIRTSSSKLDSELQNDKFFNSEKFPTLHFVSTGVKITGAQDGDVTGNLTMLGVTKPVVLHVHFNKADYVQFTGLYTAGFRATATLKRSDFGMTNYIPLVGDEVRLEVHTEGFDTDRKKADAIKH